jgi:MFS family permease
MLNIRLAYLLSYLNKSWFWIGIWVLYYLRFTNYAGIGALESLMIITSVLAEIPTGAVADLIGKKLTLSISFMLGSVGSFIMGLAPNLTVLAISIFVMTIGGALYSGTFEALVYDSLKDFKKQKTYDKVIENVSSVSHIAFALSGIVGGGMYAVNPGLPFVAVGVAYFIGFIVTLFLREPKIDTEKFSLKSYIYQTKQGFGQLFKNKRVGRSTWVLLIIGFFVVISYQSLNDIQAVEYGFNSYQLGFLAALLYIVAAFASQLSSRIGGAGKRMKGVYVTTIVFSLTFLISPILGLFSGGIMLIIRYASQVIYENIGSAVINENTESRYRATTLSTFNMIRNIPYVILAYGVGVAMDFMTAKMFAMFMGIVLIFILPWFWYRTRKL